MAQRAYWVGVTETPPHTVFHADAADVTVENYPQFAYCSGPFPSQADAEGYARTHVKREGLFPDRVRYDGPAEPDA